MKYLFYIAVISLIVNPIAWAEDSRQVIDEVVVSIDDEPFTSRELADQDNPAAQNEDKRMKGWLAAKLIEKEASKLGISVDDSEVDTYVEEILKQNDMNQAEFTGFLKTQGLSVDEYKKQIRVEILKSRVVAAEVRSKIQVTDNDIDSYFGNHPDMLPAEGSVYLYKIDSSCVKVDNSEDCKEEVQQLISTLEEKKGQPVSQIVPKENYALSDLGYLNLEETREDLVTLVKEKKEGESSSIVESERGYAFYYIFDVLEEGETVRGKLRDDIYTELFEERYKEKLKDYISEDLPARYFVDLK